MALPDAVPWPVVEVVTLTTGGALPDTVALLDAEDEEDDDDDEEIEPLEEDPVVTAPGGVLGRVRPEGRLGRLGADAPARGDVAVTPPLAFVAVALPTALPDVVTLTVGLPDAGALAEAEADELFVDEPAVAIPHANKLAERTATRTLKSFIKGPVVEELNFTGHRWTNSNEQPLKLRPYRRP